MPKTKRNSPIIKSQLESVAITRKQILKNVDLLSDPVFAKTSKDRGHATKNPVIIKNIILYSIVFLILAARKQTIL